MGTASSVTTGTLAEAAADAAVEAAREVIQALGADVGHVLLYLRVVNGPEGESDSTTLADGFESPEDMVATGIAHIAAVARGSGIEIALGHADIRGNGHPTVEGAAAGEREELQEGES